MIRNFLFHRVNPKREILWDPMDVALFEKCIRYISNNYEVQLFEDVAFSEKLHTKNKIATIMFDDGYKDNIEYAAPILKKYNCKASFYIVTNCIEHNTPTWTHMLEHSFQFTNIKDIDLNFSFLPDDLRINKLENPDERIEYVNRLKPFLKKLPHTQRQQVIDIVINTFTDIELPQLMMNWTDLKELRQEGHYIGSHTISHSMLGTISDEQYVYEELFLSGRKIEENLGYFPLSVSYPVGSYNEATKKLARKAGYKIGLAVKQNIFDPEKEDLFEVARIELYNEPWWKTRFRITNTLENIKSLIRYK